MKKIFLIKVYIKVRNNNLEELSHFLIIYMLRTTLN